VYQDIEKQKNNIYEALAGGPLAAKIEKMLWKIGACEMMLNKYGRTKEDRSTAMYVLAAEMQPRLLRRLERLLHGLPETT
jgi:hypothetical protein